jgi:hypothetical protein
VWTFQKTREGIDSALLSASCFLLWVLLHSGSGALEVSRRPVFYSRHPLENFIALRPLCSPSLFTWNETYGYSSLFRIKLLYFTLKWIIQGFVVFARASNCSKCSNSLPLWSSSQGSWLRNGDVLCFLWGTDWIYICFVEESRPPLRSNGQSSWLQYGDVLCLLWGTNWIYVM